MHCSLDTLKCAHRFATMTIVASSCFCWRQRVLHFKEEATGLRAIASEFMCTFCSGDVESCFALHLLIIYSVRLLFVPPPPLAPPPPPQRRGSVTHTALSATLHNDRSLCNFHSGRHLILQHILLSQACKRVTPTAFATFPHSIVPGQCRRFWGCSTFQRPQLMGTRSFRVQALEHAMLTAS